MKKTAIAILIAATIGFGLWRYSLREVQLSEKPPAIVSGVAIADATSRLNTTITIGYDALRQAIEQNVPSQFSDSGTHHVKTFPFHSFIGPGPAVEADAKWSLLADRGAVNVSRHDQGLKIDVPISLGGWGGLNGDLAKVVGLDKKNIRGAVQASINVTFDIGEDWCPKLKATPSFQWTSPAEIEVIGGVWINVSGKVGGDIQKALDAAAAKIPSVIDCEAIRQAIAKNWRPQVFSLGKINGSDARLVLTPTKAGFGGIRYGDRSLDLSIAMIAEDRLIFGDFPQNNLAPIPLPKLNRLAASPDRIEIILPVELQYHALASAVLKGIPVDGISGESALGTSNVKIEQVLLFATKDGKLALGLLVTAQFQKELFSTHGWIWLTGTPYLNVEKQEIAIRDLSFTRQLDNPLVRAVTNLLNEPIHHLLEQQATVDLKPKISEWKSLLVEYLGDPKNTSGVHVAIQPGVIGLENVIPGAEALLVKVRIDASASINLGEIDKLEGK